MDLLKKSLLVPFLVLQISCAKTNYLVIQGIGQMTLLQNAEHNEKVLKDPNVLEENKERIRKIQELKKYFYDYFKRPVTKIYDKTVFLKQEAVSYLVIASPYDEVKPVEVWFPIAGNFPYLGFFKEQDAMDWAKDQEEKEGMITYIRPVYAYSTTGYLDDPILSSFFRWKDWEMAYTIFHELFHTVFFIRNEIDLNEALADYFGEELAKIYFNFEPAKLERVNKRIGVMQKMGSMIKDKIGVLNARYLKSKQNGGLDRDKARGILADFLTGFLEEGKKMCAEAEIEQEDCLPLARDWNNASFAAFLTYEEEGDRIRQLHQKLSVDLPGFLKHLEERYETYKKEKPKKDGEKIEFGEYFLGITPKKS